MMTLATIIREANTEQEIYFLLTAYIDALQFGDKLNCLSEHLRKLPLTGIEDLRARSIKLVSELDAASKRLDDNVCMVIKEALEIFGVALSRLQLYQRLSPSQRLDLQGSTFGDRITGHSGATGFSSFDSVSNSAEFWF